MGVKVSYDVGVNLDELSPYVHGRLKELQYGQKGDLAEFLGISLGQLSHYINGVRPAPQKYVPKILEFFQERINIQVVSMVTGEVIRE